MSLIKHFELVQIKGIIIEMTEDDNIQTVKSFLNKYREFELKRCKGKTMTSEVIMFPWNSNCNCVHG